jgi:glycosyltransferase involved in cell wall biosynthesis
VDLKLVILGDGRYRSQLQEQAGRLGIGERVLFRGEVATGKPVLDALDQADIFVLPSHQEGLPRAMIEAMARALPCIGSTVGGIPELLPPEDMVPPGSVSALSAKILEIGSDPVRRGRMSAQNLETAQEYRRETLQKRRRAFYLFLRERTGTWMEARRIN